MIFPLLNASHLGKASLITCYVRVQAMVARCCWVYKTKKQSFHKLFFVQLRNLQILAEVLKLIATCGLQ